MQRSAMTQKSRFLIPLALAALLSAAANAQELLVKIGHTGPLSGPNAFAGRDNENGVRLAIEELNAKKIMVTGKTLKFELLSEDDQCDARTGVSVAQKLIDSGVRFVMGPYCSGVAIPASRVYSEGGAMLSTVATNPKVTENGYKNLFRITAGDSQIGSNMAIYVAKVLKLSKVAVIDDRTAYGQGVAEQFTKEAQKQGLTVVGQEFTSDKSTDFMAILTSLKAKQPQAIFFGGYAPQAAPMARQMKQLGLPAKLIGGDTLCSAEIGKLGGDAVNDTVICAQGGSMLDKLANGPSFKAKYKARFNQDPDIYAASFYDQMLFIGDSMQKIQSIEPAKVGAKMYQSSYQGVATTYGYDDKGNLQQAPITVLTFRNAMPVPLESH
ncbi:branched-chain amino acid ABC transporter substrate-binding protein [Verminephrobacter aporrectodeae subsp. tuberculatae]|uniref:Branched-chain amino acid ABC transporter substrate-binding protein n=2 Tax=Verminephrobacter TaxID=364316 RepID=A0ABT3KW77_9BURK|nr:branched-chain amino acid ABC transporter substrate-binding protein [Verminephrobacter aporrectodeae subsp. tuberculatae]MCW8174632.1 branched-chain amino acid ABC transporter substrate-binding protein [Verminephrobacter aporrectodeae subsp. tuberculatae]MCW8203022.1 branched-chain amino acid ABC transporter substrate-binding protein [Verminephrobacter aporrectodeae subsp. tuberculatae]